MSSTATDNHFSDLNWHVATLALLPTVASLEDEAWGLIYEEAVEMSAELKEELKIPATAVDDVSVIFSDASDNMEVDMI